MTLDEFEGLANANKREHIKNWPIADLFVPLIDTDLRNGIGHNSAHLDKETDQVILYDSKGGAAVSQTLGYTEFCDRLIGLFSGFELARMYQESYLHFITFCCYQRRALLRSTAAKNAAIKILEEVRTRYRFAIIGYVFMPEHVHLLIGEPRACKPAKVIQVFKQRLSRRMRGKRRARKGQLSLPFGGDGGPRRFWQRRYYDFNVYSHAKVMEKLQYMHGNPVRERLVQHPGDWPWSSWCFYYRRAGLLKMDSWE